MPAILSRRLLLGGAWASSVLVAACAFRPQSVDKTDYVASNLDRLEFLDVESALAVRHRAIEQLEPLHIAGYETIVEMEAPASGEPFTLYAEELAASGWQVGCDEAGPLDDDPGGGRVVRNLHAHKGDARLHMQNTDGIVLVSVDHRAAKREAPNLHQLEWNCTIPAAGG